MACMGIYIIPSAGKMTSVTLRHQLTNLFLYATAAHIVISHVLRVWASVFGHLGAHVEHWYAWLCRATDLEIVFLSEVIAKNSM